MFLSFSFFVCLPLCLNRSLLASLHVRFPHIRVVIGIPPLDQNSSVSTIELERTPLSGNYIFKVHGASVYICLFHCIVCHFAVPMCTAVGAKYYDLPGFADYAERHREKADKAIKAGLVCFSVNTHTHSLSVSLSLSVSFPLTVSFLLSGYVSVSSLFLRVSVFTYVYDCQATRTI